MEMIVVVIVLAVLASMAIPRLSGTRFREYELKVEQTADLMVMFAHRLSTSTKATGLQYDAPNRELFLLTLHKDSESGESYWFSQSWSTSNCHMPHMTVCLGAGRCRGLLWTKQTARALRARFFKMNLWRHAGATARPSSRAPPLSRLTNSSHR